jgi:UPF0176 protein
LANDHQIMPALDVAAFYVFAPLRPDETLRGQLQALCDTNRIRGILLLAPEGLNGTLAGEPAALAHVLQGIRAATGLQGLTPRMSRADSMPFLRMKVRLKREIVTIKDGRADPLARVGTYVEPEAWNALISDPEVMVIDTRNSFEHGVGTFVGAVDPGTTRFGEFPDFVREKLDPARHRKIAMFCTGGIRCEKASSFMLAEGFEEVYHLKGGILGYLERVPEEESLWRGGCFVFDQRVALGHGLAVAPVRLCLNCGSVIDGGALQSPLYEEGVCCDACAHSLSDEQKNSSRERHRQISLAQARGQPHLGPRPPKPDMSA